MEKTNKPKHPSEWTQKALVAALRRGSSAQKLVVLKRAGILTKSGKLSKLYRDWGDKPSRTPDER